MPELGLYGSVRGARGNSRPYRESGSDITKPTRLTQSGRRTREAIWQIRSENCGTHVKPHGAAMYSVVAPERGVQPRNINLTA